nr:MAG TPA: hypothetical protein [Bacteriophage sp.]
MNRTGRIHSLQSGFQARYKWQRVRSSGIQSFL